jgi:hypothetical protein
MCILVSRLVSFRFHLLDLPVSFASDAKDANFFVFAPMVFSLDLKKKLSTLMYIFVYRRKKLADIYENSARDVCRWQNPYL